MAPSESTTQPIICCIGEDVAGRPTQFVLERAFDADRMHWQALTVEVQVEKFSLIGEATLAMGFRGLRFYGEIERIAGQLLTRKGTLESFVGSATTALNIGGSWQVWDNRGPAWLSLLEQGLGDQPPQMTSIWLHGDDIATRSSFAALIASSDRYRWVWTDAPDEVSSIESPSVQSAIAAGRILFSDESFPAERIQELLGSRTTESLESNALNQIRLAIITSANSLPSSTEVLLQHWNLPLLIPNDLKLSSQLTEMVLHRFSNADLAVAAEAHDFLRWTTKPTDLGLLRDAYDEYCDY